MEAKSKATYIELPAFQGPLDLLLHLIQQNKVDIYNIPIAEITDQFVSTIREMEALDLDITSEFLLLAAQLLYLKSRQLLPKVQKTSDDIQIEEEMKQELIDRLIKYRAFKNIATFLGSREESVGNKYFREVDLDDLLKKIGLPDPLEGISLDDLTHALQSVLTRIEKGEDLPLYVQVDQLPVELMIRDIMRRIILNPKGVRFSQLLRYGSRVEVVIAFIALLELLKDGKIRAEQGDKSRDIYLIPTDKAWDFIDEESV